MIDQFTNVEDGDLAIPTSSLDLSARMRELRARQGLKQSEVARRMGLDPSIPSLWEQGKRLVPANRLRALADALEVTVDELLEGVDGAPPSVRPAVEPPVRGTLPPDIAPDRSFRPRPAETGPLLRLVPQATDEGTLDDAGTVLETTQTDTFVIAARPALQGWVPDGWEPDERIQDISPSLPDGYWIDPVRLEKSASKQLLRQRLCGTCVTVVSDKDVPGAALAARIYRHCSKQDGFLVAARLPLIESIFRAVLAAEYGGVTDGALVEMLRDRAGAVPVSPALLRKMRDSVRPYPIKRVDPEVFSTSRGGA